MLNKIKIGENEEVRSTLVSEFDDHYVFFADEVEKAIKYAYECGQAASNSTKHEPSFRYELVTDLDRNGIAKAMTGGEVFCSDNGGYEYYFSENGSFVAEDKTKKSKPLHLAVLNFCGSYYRKIETLWHEKLNGTIENAVLCWVSYNNEHARNDIALIVDKDEIGYYQLGEENHDRREWNYVTPFSKDELAILIANDPDKVINV